MSVIDPQVNLRIKLSKIGFIIYRIISKNSNSITSVAEPEPLVRLRNRRRFVDRPEPNLKFVLIITGNFFRALTNFS